MPRSRKRPFYENLLHCTAWREPCMSLLRGPHWGNFWFRLLWVLFSLTLSLDAGGWRRDMAVREGVAFEHESKCEKRLSLKLILCFMRSVFVFWCACLSVVQNFRAKIFCVQPLGSRTGNGPSNAQFCLNYVKGNADSYCNFINVTSAKLEGSRTLTIHPSLSRSVLNIQAVDNQEIVAFRHALHYSKLCLIT